jgi:hypothetical protein
VEKTAITITIEWENTFGGIDDDWPCLYGSLIQTTDGGFVLPGWTDSFGAGGRDFWLVKTDTNGQVEWNQTYGGIADEHANSLIQTADGGFVFVGSTKSYGAGNGDFWGDFWVIKTDVNGQEEWNQTYGGIDGDFVGSAVQTTDGGYAFAGSTTSDGAGGDSWGDFWLVKTDVNGQAEWNQTYGGINEEYATTVIQTADGGFILVGDTYSYGAGLKDTWLVKTDTNGQLEWNKTFGGTNWDYEVRAVQTTDGGFALALTTLSYGAGEEDFWLVKTDANGQVEWNSTFGGTGRESAHSMIQTSDGGFTLVGITGPDDYMWLVKSNANGQAEWNHTFGEITSEGPISLIQTTDGGYALVGATGSYDAGNGDIWLVKVSVSEGITTTTAPTTIPPTTTTTSGSPGFDLGILVLSLTLLWFLSRRRGAINP